MVKVTITFKTTMELSVTELWEVEKALLDYISSDTLVITQVEIK